MVDYSVVSEDEWNRIAEPSTEKPPSEWDVVIDDLQSGKIVKLAYNDLSDRRSKRMRISRRAAVRGFKAEIKDTGSALFFKKSADASAAPATGRRTQARQPRKRKARGE